MKKKRILFLGDHPKFYSGIGVQSNYLIEGLLKTGKYSFICLGGAVKHADYRVVKADPWGDDFTIIPVDGYGDRNLIRRLLFSEKPDALFFFTDPRFFVWLWEMEDEIHSVCPMLYWHVWDGDPIPRYNKNFYDSTDFIGAISLKTFGILDALIEDKNKFAYVPHGFSNDFKPLSEAENQLYKETRFGPHRDKKFIVFWNNRNARRKKTGDVIATFSKFMHKVGKENTALMMHTMIKDPEGQDLIAVAEEFGIDKNLIISEARIPPQDLNRVYNAVDCTVNIANAEGHGCCLASDTEISTENGKKEIQHIDIGDMVLAKDGKYHKVLNKFSRFAEALKISSLGNNNILASENHPFLVMKDESGEVEWKNAGSLKKGDMLACLNIRKTSKKQISGKNYIFTPITSIEKSISMKLWDIEVENEHSFVANGVVVHNSSTESLFAGTPIINNMTGGLQFQIGDWWKELTNFSNQEEMLALAKRKWRKQEGNWWGVPVFPAVRTCVGGQQIPYIYDDHAANEDVVEALLKLYEMGRAKRRELGQRASVWANQEFSIDRMVQTWDQKLEMVINNFKENPYKRFTMQEI